MENEPKSNIHILMDTAEDYLNTRLDLFKLKAINKTSETVSSVASVLVLFLVFFLFIVLVNIGLALLLGEWLGKSYYGFLSLAGFYLIVGLIINAFKSKWLKEPVANAIIRKAFK